MQGIFTALTDFFCEKLIKYQNYFGGF